MGEQTQKSDTSARMPWIGRREIVAIAGALKPTAYVARAYKHALEHAGSPPEWARKLESGQWLFDGEYIQSDAKENLETVGVSEAARILGVTRRAIQDWVDQGIIATTDGEDRGEGEQRRIQREGFMRDLPALRQRLETPAVVGQRIKSGRPVSQDVIRRMEARRQAAPPERKSEQPKALPATEPELDPDTRLKALEARIKAAEVSLRRTAEERNSAAREVRRREEAEARAAAAKERIKASVAAKLNAIAEARLRALKEAGSRAQEAAGIRSAAGPALRAAAEAAKTATAEKRAALKRVRVVEDADNLARAELGEMKERLAAETRAAKQRKAAAIEAELQASRAAKLSRIPHVAIPQVAPGAAAAGWEQHASGLAQKLMDEVFDERLDQMDAMLLFNRQATEQGVPDAVRIAVRKKFFGR